MEWKNLSVPISIVIAGLIIAGAIFYTKIPQKESSLAKKEKVVQGILPEEKLVKPELKISGRDHIRGNPEASVTIVEYSDFQCPFCAKFHPTLKQILTDYSDKVRLVYKHFPLDQIHPEARPAAEASECVWEQKGNEGFWQFHDGLFENQERLGKSLYRELAEKLALNMDQFNDCLSSRKYKDKVETDYQEGENIGVQGTPSSFINGELTPGAVPYDTIKTAIEKALAQ